jgi:hypothetical protein
LNNNIFTPFLVADRQASLRIISGMDLSKVHGSIGIMSHANTSENFKNVFKTYPCINREFCEVIKKTCPHDMDVDQCPEGQLVRDKTIKISDSGVFTKDGCMFENYDKLFDEYEKMGVQYGIIIDHIHNLKETLTSAKLAMKVFKRRKKSQGISFNLIGVVQGNTPDEYLNCYKKMQALGYKHIAVGGLLQKISNSARYTKVENEPHLYDVIQKIRDYDPDGWLFALGCFHRNRRSEFEKLNIFGSDYKGWIFHYTKNDEYNIEEAHNDRFKQIRKFLESNVYSHSRLLIIPCSQNKKNTDIPTAAINVYDGPFYRLLRKNIEVFDNNNGLDIYIISAKYGLIDPLYKIQTYDQKMDEKQAKRLNPKIRDRLFKIIKDKTYSEIYINTGKSYSLALEGFQGIVKRYSPNTQLRLGQGKIGQRLHDMKMWIRSE